jgi:hypothetical protein
MGRCEGVETRRQPKSHGKYIIIMLWEWVEELLG